MLSKNKIKLINSLSLKKNRQTNALFLVEGVKLVNEVVAVGMQIDCIVATTEFIEANKNKFSEFEIIEAHENDIKKASQLKTPQSVLALVKIPEYYFDINKLEKNLTIVLDDIRDPGNLGTIIRLADWFGIENIICSENSVDVYNPKVVQATMGAIARVKVFYQDLNRVCKSAQELNISIYGTFLEGENIYTENLSKNGLLIFGNESNGISSKIEAFVNKKLLIPSFSVGEQTSESLNISMAVAISCSEFKRRI